MALPLGSKALPIPALFSAGPPGPRLDAPSARGYGECSRASEGPTRRIFLVEDNAGDVELVLEALAALPFEVEVSTAHDGQDALSVLRGAARRGNPPDVILLDLNLPRMNGHEVLAELKADPALRDVPVVVLTSSSTAKDSTGSYALHAAGFVTKPTDVYEYFRVIQATARRWLLPA